jgi:general secretion pathway protein N
MLFLLRQRLICILLLTLAGMGLAIAAEIKTPAKTPAAPPRAASADKLPELPPMDFSLPPLTHYHEIVERPLFMPDRKPQQPDEQQAPTAAVTVNPPQARLIGTVITPAKRQALIQDLTAGKVVRVEQGMPVQDWQVKEILPDRLVLARAGGQPQELMLRVYDKVPVEMAAAGQMATPYPAPVQMRQVPQPVPPGIVPGVQPGVQPGIQPRAPHSPGPGPGRRMERRGR